MDELDELFEGEETAAPAEEQAAPDEGNVTVPAQPRDDEGKFAPKGEESATPAPEDDKAKGLEAGIAAERKKRQEWEERYKTDVEGLRKELEALKQPKEPEAPPPSIWEDEQATFSHYGQQFTQQAVQQATYQSKLQMSEMMARQNHEDFGEVWEPMNRFLQENPAVAQKSAESPHPWDHAYKAYKNFTTMQELGSTNLDELKASLLEQLKAEQAQQAEQAKPQLPQSLAGEQSARGSATSPDNGPMSLEEILKG